MTNTIYAFISRPNNSYELKTYTPAEFADAFKLDRSYEEWAAAGHTLDDVTEFDSIKDARKFIREERKACSITDEDADELLAELDKLEAVDGVDCYESEITPHIEHAQNGAYKYALQLVQSLEAARWLFNELQRYELNDEEFDTLTRRPDIAKALEYAFISVDQLNSLDDLIDAAQESIRDFATLGCFARVDKYERLWAEFHVCSGLIFRCAAGEWICHCTNTHGEYEAFHGLFTCSAATDVLDALAAEWADCYEEI